MACLVLGTNKSKVSWYCSKLKRHNDFNARINHPLYLKDYIEDKGKDCELITYTHVKNFLSQNYGESMVIIVDNFYPSFNKICLLVYNSKFWANPIEKIVVCDDKVIPPQQNLIRGICHESQGFDIKRFDSISTNNCCIGASLEELYPRSKTYRKFAKFGFDFVDGFLLFVWKGNMHYLFEVSSKRIYRVQPISELNGIRANFFFHLGLKEYNNKINMFIRDVYRFKNQKSFQKVNLRPFNFQNDKICVWFKK